MALQISFFATILGGVIAGVIGLSSTYISRRLERRDRHLEDHKENLRVIDLALVEMMNEIWPFHYGSEELRLGNPEFGQVPHIPPNNLLGVQVYRPLPDKNSAEIMKIDRILFRDMKNHFTRLVDSIELFEKSVKTSGTEIKELLYNISKKIYSTMHKSDFEVLKWTFDRGEKTLLRNLAGKIEEQDYGGILFLFLLGEDELEWPNKIRTLKKYNLYDGLKKVSQEIKVEIGGDIKRMTSLLGEVRELKNACEDHIEEELRHHRLKGRCKYV